MKRPRTPRSTAEKLKREVALLQQVTGALVARLGGHVELTSREIDGAEGDYLQMKADETGVTLDLIRKIKIVSKFN